MIRRTLLLGLLLSACSDPVHDDRVSKLGGETPGIPAGPRHRAGQPCLVCHSGMGPGEAEFSFAGTVYQTDDAKVPLEGAIVHLVDAAGKKHEVGTNCAGNFFVMRTDYEPTWPVFVKVIYGHVGSTPIERPMGSPIYREGSCAGCHVDPPGIEAVGHVSFATAGSLPPLPVPECRE
ncbi:MAG TPA: hypothetical protein VHE30_23580 [Polyangiaceae bacterium]|nr:hypothetical protein [Polyangiaceae bacterium]